MKTDKCPIIYEKKNRKEIYKARHSTVTVLLLIKIYYLLLFRVGSKKFNYLELSEQIALKTGGLNVTTHIDESSFQIEDYEEVIEIKIKTKKQMFLFFYRVFYFHHIVLIEILMKCLIFGKIYFFILSINI